MQCESRLRIPTGTSPEMVALLQGLLRRNAKDRMEFDEFFNHAFIRQSNPVARTPSGSYVPLAGRQSTPPKSPPAAAKAPPTPPTPPRPVLTAVTTRPIATHLEEADDFVLVPSPNQHPVRTGSRTSIAAAAAALNAAVGGHRSEEDPEICSSKPIPVPSQRGAFLKVCSSVALNIRRALAYHCRFFLSAVYSCRHR